MKNKNYILAYYQHIKDGTVTVGKWIELWYEQIVQGLERGAFTFDPKKAAAAIVFIENFCRHHEGEKAPGKIKLEEWQKAFLSVVFGIVDGDGRRQFREVVLLIGRKNGKAVSTDTEVATPGGWVRMGEIQEGDLVFGQDGKPSKVTYCSPVFDKPMYRVTFEDGAVIKASADHLWTVQTKESRKTSRYELTGANPWSVNQRYHANGGWYETTTEEMAAGYFRERPDGKGTEYKYRVPMAEPVEYPAKVLPLDPYTLGVWLGDGGKGTTSIACSNDDLAETIKNLEAEGHATKVRYPKNRAPLIDIDVTPRGKPNPTRDALKVLGIFREKKIPAAYMFAAADQRLALLQGLMDTDGFCSKAGQCEFAQKDERLTDQVRELLASLGIKSTKAKKKIRCNGKECAAFSVKFYTDKKRPCFRMSRKLERLKNELSPRMRAKSITKIERIPNEPSRCIMIDNQSHLYLVGREYTATHNTLLAAAIAAYCAFCDGEYGGRVYMAAPKLQQAGLCYDAFFQMVKKEPLLAERAKRRRTDVYIEENNTTVAPLAFSDKKSDGMNISLGICDEIASWSGPQGLRFYEVLKSSQGSRKQALLLSISTAGYVYDGIYDELLKRSTRVLLGDSRESRLAPFLYMVDDVTKWNDLNELQKSNPNLGVSVPVDYMLEEIAIAEGSLSKKNEFLAKYCNMQVNSATAWLSRETVRKASGDELRLEDFAECYAVVGIDLSRTTDLTAAVCVIERGGELYVFARFFMPGATLEEAQARDGLPYSTYAARGLLSLSGDNFVDYRDVFTWCRELIERYRIYPLMVGYDRYSSQYLVQDLNAYGFKTDDVFQGFNLSGVIKEFEGLIKDGHVHVGDNDLLKIHLLNVALKYDGMTERVRIEKTAKTDHIDGAAALLDAMTVRQKWYGELGGRLKNEE
jgi:phage terminase large subunit-like protein